MPDWMFIVLGFFGVGAVVGLTILFDARSEQQYYQRQRDLCPVCSGSGSVLLEIGPPTGAWCTRHVSLWYSIKRLEDRMDDDASS